MDENIDCKEKTTKLTDAEWQAACKKIYGAKEKEEIATEKAELAADIKWKAYNSFVAAPSVEDFNSCDFGKAIVNIGNTEPEIYPFGQKLTPEVADKILKEFNYAAKVAKVQPIEGHPGFGASGNFWDEDPRCPILNKPDEIMVKVQEVFHPDEAVIEAEDCSSDKHFILSYIQCKMRSRKVSWKDGRLCVDGAKTNVSFQSIATDIADHLLRVFSED